MSYLHNDLNTKERSLRSRRFWLIFFAILLVVILVILIPPVRQGVSGVVIGTSKVFWQAKLAIFNPNPEDEVRTEAIIAENKSLREENLLLRNMLNAVPDGTKVSLSTILSRPASSPFDTFIISGGEGDGYLPGNLVYGTDFVVLGKIAEVYSKTSKVVLFSSYQVETPVLVGPENIALSAVGRGGQNFSIDLPEGLNVSPGDALVLPTVHNSILGTVGEIKPNPDGTTRTIIARSPINMYQLRFVMVSGDFINQ